MFGNVEPETNNEQPSTSTQKRATSNQHMKILYLAHRIPYPPNKGDKIRSFNEIKYLSNKHEIHLACLADNPNDLAYQQDLKKYCRSVTVVPISPLQAKLKSLFFLLSNKPFSVPYFYSPAL